MSIGIIFISTRDPISNLTSLVFNTTYTTIGIYLEESLYLYDIWRASRPIWFDHYMNGKSYMDIEEILSCDLVSKIKLYPIDPNHVNRFRVGLARVLSMDDNDSNGGSIFDIRTTGYDIINYIFLVMENLEDRKTTGSLTLLNNAPLLSPITKINNGAPPERYDKIFTDETDRMIDMFKKEYSSSIEFREKARQARKDDLLYQYVILDSDVRSLLKENISAEVPLYKLNNIRDTMGIAPLTLEDYSSVPKEGLISNVYQLKNIFEEIISKRESNEPIVIRLDKMIDTFNEMLKSLSLQTINNSDFYCNAAILTSDENIDVEVNNKYITIYSTKLESYSKQELKEILKVVNELSSLDIKYIILQNSLIKELAKRT